jgi:acetolactate decarboxylase
MPSEIPSIRAFDALRSHRRLSATPTPPDVEALHEVFQNSTINALLEGVYDGSMTYGELRRHGDFGLGTFNALDGEIIALDGGFYQVKADGVAYPVADGQRTPFATVLFFL